MLIRTDALSIPENKAKVPRLNQPHIILIKRIFDIILSITAIPFLIICIIIAIFLPERLNQKGRIFFEQERWGKDRKVFRIYKFRSMYKNSSEFDGNGNFMQVTKNDCRVTKLGGFIRKTNIDELPQFLNVLKGDMSIVGPRPHPMAMNYEYADTIDGYRERHNVKPGITGWAQVNGLRGEIKDRFMMQKRVQYDLWYIENWSFRLDIKIIILTLYKMLKGDKAAY